MVQLGQPEGARIGRRTTLVAGVGIGAVPGLMAARLGGRPPFLRDRDLLTSGARTGEVTTSSAVVWSRGVREGRLMVRLSSNGRRLRSIRGPWTDSRARPHRAGGARRPRRRAATTRRRCWFASPDGTESTRERVRFRTAPIHAAAQSFVWSGDTCGQGWGINEELGGLTAYRAMLGTRPDFFIHCGDTIYGDEPMEETVLEPGGEIWRNLLTDAVTHVAETLEDFRGRHRYPLLDDNVRALYAEVPTISQWDDHETANNWYPGELIDDERFTERRCDVLAARGPAGVAGVPAGAGAQPHRPRPATASRRAGSTAGCRAGSTSTCSASTCAPTAAATRPRPAPRSPASSGRPRRRG